jgi:carbon-monoxide dehydrogenase large subunit
MDSDFSSEGVGTFASRSTVMGGNAVHLAALELIASARRIVEGGSALGGEDVEYSDGTFFSSRGKQLLTLAEVAAAQEGGFLFAEARFESDKVSADFGVHAAQVRIDPETGEVNVERLVLGFDIGPCINEENVRGQIYGGAVQAVGGALLEEVLYDQHGSPIVTSFADYTIPSAVESPEMTVILETGHPSSLNPLGLRGCGEAGITGAYAAIANAVARAIGDPEAVTRVPIRPEALVKQILG